MSSMTRRSAFAAIAAALVAPLAARAQGTMPGGGNAPAGGVSSTTAPSNSQGTPAGGTGITGGGRVGAGVGAPLVGGEPGTRETTRHTRRPVRRVRHRTPKPATPKPATPQ